MINTTRKQSQMLLDAGVPRESADMSNCSWSMSALWDLLHSANLPYEYCTTKDSAYVMDSLVEAVCRASRQKKIPSDFNANIIPTNEADLPDGE